MTHPFTIAVERLRTARDRLQTMMFIDKVIQDPFERIVAQNALNETYAVLRKQGVTIADLKKQTDTVWETISAYTPKEPANA